MIWVRTVRADLMMLIVCCVHGVEEALMLRHIPSPVEHIFTWVCLTALFCALVFEATYLFKSGKAWETLKTDTTLADLAGAPELPAPTPVAHGKTFTVTQGILLSSVGLFATSGAAQIARFRETWGESPGGCADGSRAGPDGVGRPRAALPCPPCGGPLGRPPRLTAPG
jgi:hypothetical protein